MSEVELAKKYEQTLEELRFISLSLQQYKARLVEIEKALKELENIEDEYVYKFVGRLLVRVRREKVIEELKNEKELVEIKVKEYQRKEKLLQERLKSLERQLRARLASKGSISGAG